MIFLLLWIALFGFIEQPVTKRGFVIYDQEGKPFLSQTPNVKSCCIKKDNNAIELQGDFGELSAFSVMSLTGTLVEESGRLKLVSNRVTFHDGLSQETLTK